MTYDYSLRFLHQNAELVKKLIQVAQSGELLTYESDDWPKLRYQHQTILSLLANISRNLEGWADIRSKVRCWTEHVPNGNFRLNVGTPMHRVTGRPPGTHNVGWKSGYVPAEQVASARYQHDATLNDSDEISRFVGRVIELGKNYTVAEARVPAESEMSEVVAWANNTFSEMFGWQARYEGWTLILERIPGWTPKNQR